MLQVARQKLYEAQDTYLEDFDRLNRSDAGRAPLWVHHLRKSAITRFAELGFPITRDLEFPVREEWLYTNVAPVAKIPFTMAFECEPDGVTRQTLVPFTFGQSAWSQLVFVNGVYADDLSFIAPLPGGVRVDSLAAALADEPDGLRQHLARHAGYDEHGLTALNTAFLHDGAFVSVPDGQVVEQPIHLLFVSTERDVPTVSYPRTLVIAGRGSVVTLVESYVGVSNAASFTNAVTEIVAGAGSVIDHYRIQRESTQAYHISTTQVYQERDSNLTSFNMAMGGALTRNTVGARLDGEGIITRLNGLYLVTGQQHIDNHTAIEHAKPNCNSYEVYKGILDGRSRGVFNGKVFVRPGAQGTDAKQLNKNLLLSPDATIDTKPQLEIFADDVKCTHGATVGQLDEEQIFYLISRGMAREIACNLLTYGFAGDLIRRLKVEAIRDHLDTLFETTIKTLVETRAGERDDV